MEFIDFRSDTVTIPTPQMLKAMVNADVGDDVYEDDPTVKELEKKSASLLGKEESLFVPSGTFGNQLSILTHTSRGQEVIIPEDNHIVLYEVGAAAVISQVTLRLLKANSGLIDMKELKDKFRTEDIHYPSTGLICMENAHTTGKIASIENIKQVHEFARDKKIPLHLDGARIFNASAASNKRPSDIAQYFDSVMFCFSKGLCAPIGSMVAGNEKFISIARRNRKMMGGGLRQAGYMAAACIVAIDEMISRLKDDHKNAKYLASKIASIPCFEVLADRLDINMVFFRLNPENKLSSKFDDKKFVSFLFENKIKINPVHEDLYRFVTHYYISEEKINYTIEQINRFIKNNAQKSF